MRHPLQHLAFVFAACLPLALPAQLAHPVSEDQDAPRRVGTWEVSVVGGTLMLDHSLRDFLQSGRLGPGFIHELKTSAVHPVGSTVVATPGRSGNATTRVYPTEVLHLRLFAPTAELRVGYNIDRHFGVSLNAAQASAGGVTSLFIGPAVTWTMDLDRSTRPFVLAGSDYQRITGANGESVEANWGAHVGIGMRQMLTEHTALRLEGRLRMSVFNEVATRSGLTYSPVLLIGLSHFVGGSRGAP